MILSRDFAIPRRVTKKRSKPHSCQIYSYHDCDTNMFYDRPFHERFTDRMGYTQISKTFMRRRMLYPRVSLYGGLYCPRRPVNDDSFIRLIEKANQESLFRTGTDSSTGSLEFSSILTVSGNPSGRPESGLFSLPAYMSSRTVEPKFCFGGGLFT